MAKKYLFLIVLVMLSGLSLSCNMDGDVLATFADKEITRGEFHSWLKNLNAPTKVILKKKTAQKVKLQELAVEIYAYEEAKGKGYEKDEGFKVLHNLIKRNLFGKFLTSKLREDGEFNEEVVRVRQIRLVAKSSKRVNKKYVKLNKAEIAANLLVKKELAESIIKKLKKGAEFAKLARKYSNDHYRKKGGDIGYISRGMRRNELIDAVFSMKKGQFSEEPIVVKGSMVYIFLVEDRCNVTNENIGDIIDDEKQRERLRNRLLMMASKEFEKSIKESDDVISNIDTVNFSNPDAELYKIGSTSLTVSGLNRILTLLYEKRGKNIKDIDEKFKRAWSQKFFRDELLYREAIKRELDKDDEFKDVLKGAHHYALANSYIDSIIVADLNITDEDVSKEHNRIVKSINKQNRAAKSGVRGRMRKMPTRNQIREGLFYRKRKNKRFAWQAKLLKKLNFDVDDSALEGK